MSSFIAILQPEYVEAKKIRPFVSRHYDGILLPGESEGPLADLPQAYFTDPWLSRDAIDLPGSLIAYVKGLECLLIAPLF